MKRFHLHATKSYLCQAIAQHGVEVLAGFKGTAEEAIAAIVSDPRDVIPVGPCDHQDERGNCLGHPGKRAS